MDPILEHRVRAKKLAELAGVEAHPWANAEKELKAAIAEEKRREAEEADRKDRAEAEQFTSVLSYYRAAIADYKKAKAELDAAHSAMAKMPAEAQKYCQRVNHWLGSAHANLMRSEGVLPYRGGDPDANMPRVFGAPPTPLTWRQTFLANEFWLLAQQAEQRGQCARNILDSLHGYEREFPALRDIREAEGL